MRILYGNSLGWEALPRLPKTTSGYIFTEQKVLLPWFTYPAIAQLLRMDIKGERLLEYGSGSSTVFFIEQGCSVYSIEDNHDWATLVKSRVGNSAEIKVIPEQDGYVQTAKQLAKLNPSMIVVDGLKRKECAAEIRDYLKNNLDSKDLWMIILDNSDWHGSSYAILSDCKDFVGFDFYGHGPYNSYTWCTSLFVRIEALQLHKRIGKCGPAMPMRNGLPNNFSSSL